MSFIFVLLCTIDQGFRNRTCPNVVFVSCGWRMKYTTCLQDECIVYAPCTSKTNCHMVGLKPIVPNLAQRFVYSRLFKYALQVSQRTAVGPHTSQGPRPTLYIWEVCHKWSWVAYRKYPCFPENRPILVPFFTYIIYRLQACSYKMHILWMSYISAVVRLF